MRLLVVGSRRIPGVSRAVWSSPGNQSQHDRTYRRRELPICSYSQTRSSRAETVSGLPYRRGRRLGVEHVTIPELRREPPPQMTKSRFRERKKKFFWFCLLLITFGRPTWLLTKDAPAVIPIAWSLLGIFLLMFPRSCRATNTDGTLCGNNAYGLLGGCHFQRHKRQNAWRIIPLRRRPVGVRADVQIVRTTMVVGTRPPPVAPNDTGLWGTPTAVVTTVGSLSSGAGAI